MLSREQILAKERERVVAESVPEWEGEVYLRPLGGGDLLELYEPIQAVAANPIKAIDAASTILARCVVDADGAALLEAGEWQAVRVDVLLRLVGRVLEVSEIAGPGEVEGNS